MPDRQDHDDFCGRFLRSKFEIMAGCGGEPSALESHGSRHDFFHVAEFFLRIGRMGHVVDRMDMGQHRSQCAREEKPAGRENCG